MVYVVVPVAIYQHSIDEVVAKENVLSQICPAFLAVHVRVTAARMLCLACYYPRAIFPTTFLVDHYHLTLANMPRQFAVLIFQQRIIICRLLHRWHHQQHSHHPLCIGANLQAGDSTKQFHHILSPAWMFCSQLPKCWTPFT